jgi:hypothetical protein
MGVYNVHPPTICLEKIMSKFKGTIQAPTTAQQVQTVQTPTTQNQALLKGLPGKSLPENPNKQEA